MKQTKSFSVVRLCSRASPTFLTVNQPLKVWEINSLTNFVKCRRDLWAKTQSCTTPVMLAETWSWFMTEGGGRAEA